MHAIINERIANVEQELKNTIQSLIDVTLYDSTQSTAFKAMLDRMANDLITSIASFPEETHPHLVYIVQNYGGGLGAWFYNENDAMDEIMNKRLGYEYWISPDGTPTFQCYAVDGRDHEKMIILLEELYDDPIGKFVDELKELRP